VLPQYHVVFNDLFTTVSFMEKSKVPPNWADLVEKSCEKVTDEHYELAKTWPFLSPEPGDISIPEKNFNASNDSNLGAYSKKTTPHTRIEPPCLSSFLDKTNGLFQSMDYVQDPFLHPVSSSYEGANLPSQIEDSLVVPHLINLETSGQRRSSRIAAMINRANHDGLEIAVYTTSPTQLLLRRITPSKPKHSFLSVFKSVGALCTFAPQNHHSNEQFSFVAQISNDFEQINGLFDDTINNFCHRILAFTTSNEAFT
jgi:hypothetical protein